RRQSGETSVDEEAVSASSEGQGDAEGAGEDESRASSEEAPAEAEATSNGEGKPKEEASSPEVRAAALKGPEGRAANGVAEPSREPKRRSRSRTGSSDEIRAVSRAPSDRGLKSLDPAEAIEAERLSSESERKATLRAAGDLRSFEAQEAQEPI